MKLTDFEQTFLNNMDNKPTLLLMANALKKKLKKMPPHKKFFATAQSTLSFFLLTHEPNAEKKMKECFRQCFKNPHQTLTENFNFAT